MCETTVSIIRNWVGVLAPVASVFAAVTAMGVALWVAKLQREIQERQLRRNLFDKRYAILLLVQEFLAHVLKMDGAVDLQGDECRRFWNAMAQAEFLFDSDVNSYMNEIKQTVLSLHTKHAQRNHWVAMREQDKAEPVMADILKILAELSGSFLEKPIQKLAFQRLFYQQKI
jgi:hypothetical protein